MLELDFEPDDPATKGVKRIAGALLIQAYMDVTSGSNRKRLAALGWVDYGSNECFGFTWCCRAIDRDPEHIKRVIKQGSCITAADLFGAQSP